MPFVYSKDYFADIGYHVFPIAKYRLIYEKLLAETNLKEPDFSSPQKASYDDLLLVHTSEYIEDLLTCAQTHRTDFSELPLDEKIIDMFTLASGGTILAAQQALEAGWCVHICGGFHHAFADKAEGFCYLNDLAIAAKRLQTESQIKRIAIIDCDLHQGNGTAHIFQGDDSVFTFSVHQKDLYPKKEESDLDIHLPIHITDKSYLKLLKGALKKIFMEFSPEFVFYQAGADPYKNDQLGSLALSIEGLKKRDEMVIKACKQAGSVIAVTLGGGYAHNTNDTVQIHFNTCLAAQNIFSK